MAMLAAMAVLANVLTAGLIDPSPAAGGLLVSICSARGPSTLWLDPRTGEPVTDRNGAFGGHCPFCAVPIAPAIPAFVLVPEPLSFEASEVVRSSIEGAPHCARSEIGSLKPRAPPA